MRIQNINNRTNFGNVYGVYGTKEQLDDFDRSIMRGNKRKAHVQKYDYTQIYLDNAKFKPHSKGILTQEAVKGKKINIYITGKEDCDNVEFNRWQQGSITQHLQRAIDASKRIPKEFRDEFTKSAHSLINED